MTRTARDQETTSFWHQGPEVCLNKQLLTQRVSRKAASSKTKRRFISIDSLLIAQMFGKRSLVTSKREGWQSCQDTTYWQFWSLSQGRLKMYESKADHGKLSLLFLTPSLYRENYVITRDFWMISSKLLPPLPCTSLHWLGKTATNSLYPL